VPSRLRTRLRILELGIPILALLLGLRLFQVQILEHSMYMALAVAQWETKISLPAPRGNLYDRAGTPLAVSSFTYAVTVDPAACATLRPAARDSLLAALAQVLDKPAAQLDATIARAPGRYLELAEGLELSVAQSEALLRHGGLHLERRPERLYPLGALGAALIGRVNSEGDGAAGLEAGLQATLAGKPGQALESKDNRGRPLVDAPLRVLVEPVPGRDAVLSIDSKVQAIVEMELERAAQEFHFHGGSVVVLDPHTGDLLALASWPAPAQRKGPDYDPAQWRLLPVQAAYEPGSTMKALTSIALLEHGDMGLETQADAGDGRFTFADGVAIRDDKNHYGWLSFRQAFTVSSNICFAQFATRISDEELYACLRDLGFGSPLDLGLPGENAGLLRRPGEWSKRSRRTIIFGQEISASPLQMTVAAGALAAEGVLMRPRLILRWSDPETGQVEASEPVRLRRVCRPATARTICDLMGNVVKEGTGKAAAVPGLPVGGKTGTAQKFAGGDLLEGKYVGSFIGIAPLDAPALVVGIFLDEPDRAYSHGGSSAAPTFARIVERLAVSTPYLYDAAGDDPHRDKGESLVAPVCLELTPDAAVARLHARGLDHQFQGRGRRVISQRPGPGSPLRPDDRVILVLGDPEAPASNLPELRGLSLREARRRAMERGFAVHPTGWGVVVQQGVPDPNLEGAIPITLAEPKRAEPKPDAAEKAAPKAVVAGKAAPKAVVAGKAALKPVAAGKAAPKPVAAGKAAPKPAAGARRAGA
jgi:stage V sporulation protein D (sporulation-specific penicillin-binding protein)